MTVQELIDALSTLNRDQQVVLHNVGDEEMLDLGLIGPDEDCGQCRLQFLDHRSSPLANDSVIYRITSEEYVRLCDTDKIGEGNGFYTLLGGHDEQTLVASNQQ